MKVKEILEVKLKFKGLSATDTMESGEMDEGYVHEKDTPNWIVTWVEQWVIA